MAWKKIQVGIIQHSFSIPTTGDMIFFYWIMGKQENIIDYDCIVKDFGMSSTKITTIEWNSPDSYRENIYDWNDIEIAGYVRLGYFKNETIFTNK